MSRSTCAHCGDPCTGRTYRHEAAVFCCAGCRTVYTLLHENGLAEFYALDERAGRSQRSKIGQDYDWLEVEELAKRLLSYHDEQRWVIRLELPAIHCISCVWLLERLPRFLPGVRSCMLDVTRKVATIDFDPRRLNLAELARTLAGFGYPPRIHGKRRESPGAGDRSLLYRIGVAGFCFGNIMLLSFPEYLGLGGYSEDGQGSVLPSGAESIGNGIGILLLGLSLPVLCYAGTDFFRDAWRGLRAGRVTINVPIAIGMAALTLRSVYEIASGIGPGYLDSLAGLVFFLLLGRWFQGFTFARLRFDRDYHDYFPLGAYRLGGDGTPVAVATEQLTEGDRILVKPGQLIPTDGVLGEAGAREIDYSFVTGEAEPQRVEPGAEVFAGGRATVRALQLSVTRPVDRSYLLQLWRGQSGREEHLALQPPERLVRMFTAVILLIAVATFGYWYRTDVATAYRAATAVLIIACPCALALATPFAYGTLQRLLGRTGWYLRSAAVLRNLAGVSTFVFDKTGTLMGREAGHRLDTAADPATLGVLLGMASRSAHPRSEALCASLAATGVSAAVVTNVAETPGGGLVTEYAGHHYRIGQRAFCGLGEADGVTYAVADGREVAKLHPPRPRLRQGVADMLYELGDSGNAYLLSGDRPPEGPFWTGYLPEDHVYFGMSPFGKEDFIRRQQDRGRRVLMVGDGLNDAGALRSADVGLAVAETDASFSPACDGIVAAARLSALPLVLRAARRIGWVTAVCYGFAFCYNLVGLWYAVTGTLSPVVAAILMPLSSITIVGLATAGGWWVYRAADGT
jgi:Cu+-exporting ATPase